MCFITNAGGVTHHVSEDDFNRLNATQGFRAATEEEIASWKARHLPPAPDGNAVETVLPTTGVETNNLDAPSGGHQSSASPLEQSSTGDFDATNSQPTTRKPAPDSTAGVEKRARKNRSRDSV